MLPIGLLIQRKTKVPTKNAIVHAYRSDWIKVAKIDYSESPRVLKAIDGTGAIDTEAQFCYMMYKNFGPGEYQITAWRTRRKGFWNFLKVILTENGFQRIERKITQEERENKELLADYHKVQKDIREAESNEEKNQIKESASDILEEVELNKEIIDNEKSMTKRGPAPYLKAAVPVYQMHDYEDWETTNKSEVAAQESGGFW